MFAPVYKWDISVHSDDTKDGEWTCLHWVDRFTVSTVTGFPQAVICQEPRQF